MDDLMELILEVLVEGGAAAMGSRRVPLPVRVAIGAVLAFLAAVLLGLAALLLLAGADGGSPGLCAMGAGMILLLALFCGGRVRRFRSRRRARDAAADRAPREK